MDKITVEFTDEEIHYVIGVLKITESVVYDEENENETEKELHKRVLTLLMTQVAKQLHGVDVR